MSMLHIWNPAIVPDHPDSLEFILTRGDSDAVAGGTRQFAEELLQDIGIQATVTSWSIKPYRTSYFSEYLDSDDWQDTWQPVWKVRIVTTAHLGRVPKIDGPWTETDATDGSWSRADYLDDDTVIGCLVISDFTRKAALNKAQSAITKDETVQAMQRRYAVRAPAFSHSVALGKYPQLQIDLGAFPGEFFAHGADYAVHVRECCRQMGGRVNFADRLA